MTMTESLVGRWFSAHCALVGIALAHGVVTAAAMTPGASPELPSGTGKTDHNLYRDTVLPLFRQHCVKCHGPQKQEGKLALHTLGGPSLKANEIGVEKWQAVREKLVLAEMPPDSEPRPDALVVQKVVAWIESELTKGGVEPTTVDRKLLLPGNGNRVDHRTLFAGTIRGPAASRARLWRMSPQSYLTFLPRVSGLESRSTDNRAKAKGQRAPSRFAQPFSSASADGFQDYADLFAVDEPTVVQLMRNARQIAEIQTTKPTNKGGRDKRVKEFLPLVSPKRPPTAEETETAIRKQFHLALLREPTDEEMQRFLRLADENAKSAGQVIGAKYTLTTILMLPEALYRIELGHGSLDEHGRLLLSPRELAYGIAFALTDAPPDIELLTAAASGKLASREDVHREVQRILDDDSIAKTRILRFFEEYFDFPAVEEVFKDLPRVLDVFPGVGGSTGRQTLRWWPHILANDTRNLIRHVLQQDRDVLKELLTTNKSFVNYGFDAKKGKPGPAIKPRNEYQKLSHYYGLPSDWEWTDEQPVELPADQRAGILTQPSWLAAFATNDENHAIRRGKWVRERLLGGFVPDVPIAVDAQLPHAPDKTLRERMEVTKDQYCWRCHQKMNPIGLAFESYDFLGWFRNTETVVDLSATKEKRESMAAEIKRKGKDIDAKIKELSNVFAYRDLPIDSTGQIAHSGDAKLDGPVTGTVELMHRLADSPRVRQIFVRHAFRYWMGRNETLTDAPTMLAADRAYVESDGSMKALITSLMTSDSFIYRKETRQESLSPPPRRDKP